MFKVTYLMNGHWDTREFEIHRSAVNFAMTIALRGAENITLTDIYGYDLDWS